MALALTKIKESGGAAIPLDVSIASHSSLMQEAEDQMRSYVGGVEVADPHKPVILNTTAKPAKNAQEISNEIPSALTSSVRWDETIRYMREAEGATVFREVGPGEVLANMLRKNRDSIRGEIEVYSSKDLIPDFHR